MLLEILPVGPFQCNCMILGDEKTRTGVIIDPGDEADRILEVVRHFDLTITHLLHTHGHLDHIGATARVHQETGGKICIHGEDQWLYENLKMQGDLFGLRTDPVLPIQDRLVHGSKIELGPEVFETLHTPGHTPGSVCFRCRESNDSEALFSGDTLFQGSVGRTDLWGGSHESLIESIVQKLLPLPEDTIVYPGHGPKTTIGEEKRRNPFLQE